MISESRQGWRRQWVKVKPRTLRKALARKSIRKRAMMSFGRKKPDPGKVENEKTAQGAQCPGMRRFGYEWPLARRRRPASAKACSRSGFVPRVKTLRRAGRDLGFAASHNDVKSWHSVLPKGNRGEALIEMPHRIAKAGRHQNGIWPSR
ncbi:hypothetical protein LB566_13410 [Mesorhizobium sp. CA13]|uniref:hypothetical protein n=1 Tax=Mesorhizobium sp. CA13 TaxID=2876643 RepID=UPI001CCA0B92|nr:hypothetical protein [Mesorhizobium sp. CA13]MBZ9854801.1 hypothetical protein [Mesorhizobium sp. CA13]MCA0013208.1 hypothetical protein [Mesorhizobium sp. B294B1A1]